MLREIFAMGIYMYELGLKLFLLLPLFLSRLVGQKPQANHGANHRIFFKLLWKKYHFCRDKGSAEVFNRAGFNGKKKGWFFSPMIISSICPNLQQQERKRCP